MNLTRLCMGPTVPIFYLATKYLQILISSISQERPTIAESMKKDFCMDDYMTGSDILEEALMLQRTTRNLLASAELPLRKYESNSSEFLSAIYDTFVEFTNE